MAALDFPASPTVNQLATLTNGFTYQWDGAVWTLAAATGQQAGGDLTGTYPNPSVTPAAKSKWTDTGTALTPVGNTKPLVVPAAVAGTSYAHALTLGSKTVKVRVGVPCAQNTTDDGIYLSVNRDIGIGTLDDTTKSAWQMGFNAATSGDMFGIGRQGPSPAGYGNLLTLDAGGKLALPVNADPLVSLGASAIKGGITSSATDLDIHVNHPWFPGDTTKSSWDLKLSTSAGSDQFLLYHRLANAGAGAVTLVLAVNGDGSTHCTLAPGPRNSGAYSGGSWSTYNTWLNITSQTITTKGGLVIVTVNLNLSYNQLSATPNVLIDQWLLRDGNPICEVPRQMGGAVVMPLVAYTWVDNPPAGLHTYTAQIYIQSGTSAVVTGTTGNSGTLMMNEIGGG